MILTCALVMGGWYAFLLVDGKSLISDGAEEKQSYDQFRTELLQMNELMGEFNESEKSEDNVLVLQQAYDHFKQAAVYLDQFLSYFSYRLIDPYVLHEIQYEGEGEIFSVTIDYIMGDGDEGDILYLMEYSSKLLDVFPVEYIKKDRNEFFTQLNDVDDQINMHQFKNEYTWPYK